MGNLCKISVFFMFAVITLFWTVSSNADEYEHPDWISSVSGVYRGMIFSSGDHLPGKTEFMKDDAGALNGQYSFSENGKKVYGVLFDCQVLGKLRLACTWRDKYGSGELVVSFDDSLSSFDGYWTMSGNSEKSAWNGTRQ